MKLANQKRARLVRTNKKPREQRLAVAGCEVLVQLTCPLSLTPVSVCSSSKSATTTTVYVFHFFVEKMADNTVRGALKRKLEQLRAR